MKLFTSTALTVAILALTYVSVEAIQARVELSRQGTNYHYTVINDEILGSQDRVCAFHLDVNAPFIITSTPAGWGFETDNTSYVDWFSTSSNMPFSGDIAPGGVLSGFNLQSKIATSEPLNFAVVSWDQGASNSSAAAVGSVEVPSILTVAAHLTPSWTNNTFQLMVSGVPAATYIVEVSADLQTWTPAITNASPFTYLKTNSSSFTHEFFRAVFESGYSGEDSDVE